jgi:diguanylate cyclase (GGDEF)-like protein
MAIPLPTAAASLTRAAQRVFTELACDVAMVLSADGKVEFVNENGCSLLSDIRPRCSLKGQSIFPYVQDACIQPLKDGIAQAMAKQQSDLEIHFQSSVGEDVHVQSKIFWDENTDSLWLVGHDLSQMRELETQLRQQASHDELTGLPNRTVLAERLEARIEASRQGKTRFSAVGIDLDGFKRVNDAMGHFAGDQLLREIANRIKACLRESDTVCRTGGDEFFLVLPEVSDPENAKATCARVLEAIRRPVMIQGVPAYVSASIGIALFPEHGSTASDLVQHADLAMYQAKALGKNRISIFESELRATSSLQMSLEAAMHQGLRDGEFMVYYQPLVDSLGNIKGCEALLRWCRPDGSWISPAEFIPVAESTGLITVLGDYVLRTAAMQLRLFDESGLPGLFMSVNVSPRQLRSPNFDAKLTRALEISGIEPSRLVLEITENMLMGGPDRSQALLRGIAATGVRISLDDFGTGYSCLAYLKTYPISGIKVDRSFLAELASDVVSQAIVRAILELARALQLYTVIEGVETQEQSDVLQAMKADYLQGYLFSRPVPPHMLLAQFAPSPAV